MSHDSQLLDQSAAVRRRDRGKNVVQRGDGHRIAIIDDCNRVVRDISADLLRLRNRIANERDLQRRNREHAAVFQLLHEQPATIGGKPRLIPLRLTSGMTG